jgi:hypothetical protein
MTADHGGMLHCVHQGGLNATDAYVARQLRMCCTAHSTHSRVAWHAAQLYCLDVPNLEFKGFLAARLIAGVRTDPRSLSLAPYSDGQPWSLQDGGLETYGLDVPTHVQELPLLGHKISKRNAGHVVHAFPSVPIHPPRTKRTAALKLILNHGCRSAQLQCMCVWQTATLAHRAARMRLVV